MAKRAAKSAADDAAPLLGGLMPDAPAADAGPTDAKPAPAKRRAATAKVDATSDAKTGATPRAADEAKPAPRARAAKSKAEGGVGGGGGLNADARFIVLAGKEDLLRVLRTRQIRDTLTSAHGEIDVVRFDGDAATPAEVLDECRSFGLIARHKMVVVDRADQLVKGEARPLFERYALGLAEQGPSESGATLVLRCDTWLAGKLDAMIGAVGAIIKCEALTPAAAADWAVRRARKEHDAALDAQAAEMLVERLGTDLGRLSAEVAKLAAVAFGIQVARRRATGATDLPDPATEPAPIGPELVARWTGVAREEDAWTIQAALLAATPGQALEYLRELLDVSREPAQKIAYSVLDLARKLHGATAALKAGANPQEVASKMKLWGPSRDAVLGFARNGSPTRTLAALRASVTLDKRAKSGFCDAETAVEGMVLALSQTIAARR